MSALLTAYPAGSDLPVANAPGITKPELLGQFDPSTHPDFVLIDARFTDKKGIYLRSEPYDSLKRMIASAKTEGINLTVISATRNFDYQKGIWQRKWSGDKFKTYQGCERAKQIMKYSSMPGTSRHHWGTDIDLNSVDPAYFNSGQGRKIYEWLVIHAPAFGFYQTYTAKSGTGRTGFEEEKWHWSFIPLAETYLKEYNLQITPSDFTGFDGSGCAQELNVIENYVNGIDSLVLARMK
jgi:LAS superfamily LD-carboxypeptidase LdcB